MKAFSFSHASKEEKVRTDREQLSPREISGYVTYVYDNQWWVAYTPETHNDTEEITLSFLHPHGPSRSFNPLNAASVYIRSKITSAYRGERIYTLTIICATGQTLPI